MGEAGCWIFFTVRKNSKVLPVASGQLANDRHSFSKSAKPSGQSCKWPLWGRTEQNLQWMDLSELWLTVGWMAAFIQIHPLEINMLLLTQTYSVWKILSSIFLNIVNCREGFSKPTHGINLLGGRGCGINYKYILCLNICMKTNKEKQNNFSGIFLAWPVFCWKCPFYTLFKKHGQNI